MSQLNKLREEILALERTIDELVDKSNDLDDKYLALLAKEKFKDRYFDIWEESVVKALSNAKNEQVEVLKVNYVQGYLHITTVNMVALTNEITKKEFEDRYNTVVEKINKYFDNSNS